VLFLRQVHFFRVVSFVSSDGSLSSSKPFFSLFWFWSFSRVRGFFPSIWCWVPAPHAFPNLLFCPPLVPFKLGSALFFTAPNLFFLFLTFPSSRQPDVFFHTASALYRQFFPGIPPSFCVCAWKGFAPRALTPCRIQQMPFLKRLFMLSGFPVRFGAVPLSDRLGAFLLALFFFSLVTPPPPWTRDRLAPPTNF